MKETYLVIKKWEVVKNETSQFLRKRVGTNSILIEVDNVHIIYDDEDIVEVSTAVRDLSLSFYSDYMLEDKINNIYTYLFVKFTRL